MGEIPMEHWSWINAVAERFERAWKAGPRPRIEDYLADIDEQRRAQLLEELLRVERELRRRAGEESNPDEFHRRFPEHTAAVDAAFGDAASIRTEVPDAIDFGLPPNRRILAKLAETIGSVPRVL